MFLFYRRTELSHIGGYFDRHKPPRFDRIYDREQAKLWTIYARGEKVFGAKTFLHLGTYINLYMLEFSMKWPFPDIYSFRVNKNLRLQKPRFAKTSVKRSRIIAWELKLEWEHLSRAFVDWFSRKCLGELQTRGYRKATNKNRTAHGLNGK